MSARDYKLHELVDLRRWAIDCGNADLVAIYAAWIEERIALVAAGEVSNG